MKFIGREIQAMIAFIAIVLLLLFLVACGGTEPTEGPGLAPTAGPVQSQTTVIVVASTVPVMTATTLPPETVTPAEIVVPVETLPPVTPSPTLPPARHENVDQVAYAASDCSDKYPCNEDLDGWEARILVPADLEASVFSQMDDFPTSLTFGPDGRLYVAGHSGSIYQLDESGQATTYASGFKVPTGIAFQPGTERLYVSSRVTDVNVDGEGKISVVTEGQVMTLFEGLPCCYVGMHGPNGIAFGPDGFGYVGVGGRADHGERLVEPNIGEPDDPHPLEAAILRFSPDGESLALYAHGFRNPYDVAWDGDGRLFATDNGHDTDLESGLTPPDELHLVVPGGEHGYPYYECSGCFGVPDGVEVIPPILELIPHAAVTGLTAYTDELQPAYYNDIFMVAWSAFEGAQKVVRFSPDSGESSDFATGFAQPIDITVGPDGDLYVADFATGLIYRLSFLD